MPYKMMGAIALLLLQVDLLSAQKNDSYQTAMYLGQWEKAVTIQEANCAKAPADWQNWFYMADAYAATDRPEDVKKALQKAAQNNPQDAYEYIVNGRLAWVNGDQETAAQMFKKAAKSGKKDATALRLLGHCWLYGKGRDLKQAESYLLDAKDRNSTDFLTNMDLGYCYMAMIDGGKALVLFDQAQLAAPNNPLPALMSAMAYKNAKIPAKQIDYLDKALAIDPKNIAAQQEKAAYYYYQKRDFAASVTAYSRLFEITPDASIDDKMVYANALFLTKQYDQTIAWVDKIIQQDGSRNYLRRLAAYAYYETGDYEKGKTILQDYFARVDSSKIIPQDYEYYAKLLLKDSQDSLAAVYYQKTIDLDSSRWELYSDIGSIRYKTGDYQGAAIAYERRLDSLENRSALDYYQVGLAYYMMRDSADYVKASDYFAKVCEIVPDKTTGWLIQAKTLSKLEPDIQAHPDSVGAFGKAKDAFDHFVAIAEAEGKEKYDKDLITAYEYLAYYYVLQEDTENVQANLDKLVVLEPENESAAGITEWLESVEAQN